MSAREALNLDKRPPSWAQLAASRLPGATPRDWSWEPEDTSKLVRENQHQTCEHCQAVYYWDAKMRKHLSKPLGTKHLDNLLHAKKDSFRLPQIRLTQIPMQQCSRCKRAVYCNSLCQRLNWPLHEQWCKPLPFKKIN